MKQSFLSVIGVGYWGKNIVRNFAELGVLRSVCDANAALLKQCQAQHHVPACSDFNEVLGDPAVKAVAIATPAASHYTIAKAALLAGKDVFVEKPLALDL